MGRPASDMRSNTDQMRELGSLLRARRKELNLTQQDVADLADVGVRLVHELEHGSEAAKLGNVRKVLRVLGFRLCVEPSP
jgi:HTH-type transcriptional regulator / antitoxin HipB